MTSADPIVEGFRDVLREWIRQNGTPPGLAIYDELRAERDAAVAEVERMRGQAALARDMLMDGGCTWDADDALSVLHNMVEGDGK